MKAKTAQWPLHESNGISSETFTTSSDWLPISALVSVSVIRNLLDTQPCI